MLIRKEYKKDRISQLILQNFNNENNTNLTLEEVEILMNNEGDYFVIQKDENNPNSVPPYYDVSNYGEILALLNWASHNNEMVEIVYKKRKRGEPSETTARIVTVLSINDDYLKTHCHVTLRGSNVEYHSLDDHSRTFIIPNIERVRLTSL